MQDRIKQTLASILDVFKSGQIPEKVAFAAFPPFKVPSVKWSYLNHILMMINETSDARGFKQWLDLLHPEDKEKTLQYLNKAEAECAFWLWMTIFGCARCSSAG